MAAQLSDAKAADSRPNAHARQLMGWDDRPDDPGHIDRDNLTAVGSMVTVPPRRIEPREVLDLADRLIAAGDAAGECGAFVSTADAIAAADWLQLLALRLADEAQLHPMRETWNV